MIARRLAWTVVGVAALPGLAVGVVTGYAFVIAPVVLASGFVVRRSTAGVGFALGCLAAAAIGLMIGLAVRWGGSDWWFFAIYGTSSLLALMATFKVGTEARVRLGP